MEFPQGLGKGDNRGFSCTLMEPPRGGVMYELHTQRALI